ncbi:MAG: hypothetical protein ACREB8_12845 [Pseudolabrys sp.]
MFFGEEFIAKSEHEGVVFGATGSDVVEGFVPRASLAPKPGRVTHRVRRTFIHIYSAPDLLRYTGEILPMNALVETTGRSGAARNPSGGPGSTMVELRSGGWVTDQGLSPIGHFESEVQAVARMFIGAVYLPGGKTWLGCDGPGFIQTALAACGLSIPRRFKQQIDYFERKQSTNGEGVAPSAVIFSNTSCGFLFGKDVIAARVQSMQVDVSSREKFLVDSKGQPRIFSLK